MAAVKRRAVGMIPIAIVVVPAKARALGHLMAQHCVGHPHAGDHDGIVRVPHAIAHQLQKALVDHRPLVERWAARTRAYWAGRIERDHYFWFHYLFAECYARDAAFRAVWDATPEILARDPHVYEPYLENLWGRASERDRHLVDRPSTPLVKLTRRLPPGDYPNGSAIRYLCQRAFARAVS